MNEVRHAALSPKEEEMNQTQQEKINNATAEWLGDYAQRVRRNEADLPEAEGWSFLAMLAQHHVMVVEQTGDDWRKTLMPVSSLLEVVNGGFLENPFDGGYDSNTGEKWGEERKGPRAR
jgi:hypothetical protein